MAMLLYLIVGIIVTLHGKSAQASNETDRAPSSTCFCGESNEAEDRIVGGGIASPFKYPWFVELEIFWKQLPGSDIYGSGSFSRRCGGTLISNRWVITAGHCLKKDGYRVDYVVGLFGKHNENIHDGGEVVARQSNIVYVHPQFKAGMQMDYDVALVKFLDEINFEQYWNIRPVCKPPLRLRGTSPLPKAGEMVTVIGLGRTEHEDYPTALREVDLPIQTRATCTLQYDRTTDRQFCAGLGFDGKSPCSGDSGGPALMKKWNGHYMILGIVSFGNSCGQDYTDVFTLVNNPEIRGYIDRITKDDWTICHRKPGWD